MQTPEQQVEMYRQYYSNSDIFTHEGVAVRVVAYILWTNKQGVELWVFKLSNRITIKVRL